MSETSPFEFGQVAQRNFVNRTEELKKLLLNFESGINTMLLSPRRWGKTTLLTHATRQFCKSSKQHRALHIDLYNIYTPEEFYTQLAKGIIRITSSKTELAIQTIQRYLSNLKPTLHFSAGGQELEISFEKELAEKDHEHLLNLAEQIAQDRQLKIVICIDEFQNCTRFNDPIQFQQRLRAHWQHHQHVSYCLYGSQRNMLASFFESPSMPFYKFGELIFLQKIEAKHWLKHIIKRFENTGKSANTAVAERIVELSNNHPYYVQYLSHLVWQRIPRGGSATTAAIELAMKELIQHQRPYFLSVMGSLSSLQVNFLKAIVSGEDALSSHAILKQYQLVSSAHVARVKDALEKKDVIDTMDGSIDMVDPILAYWIKTTFMK